MAKAAVAKWRESASLIILAKDNAVASAAKFDYKVLLFSRHGKASFMPNTSVFPGGVCEPADKSPLWLAHFNKYGLQEEKMRNLSIIPANFDLDAEGNLKKNISLRITAIRETFEEVGILFCRDRGSLSDSNGFGHVRENFDREHWQQTVHKDPTQFLTLCQELDVVPDLWNLQLWSAWMTPSTFTKRFTTTFYLVSTQNTPTLFLEEHEVADHAWKTPMDYLKAHAQRELTLPPPQSYELARLVNFAELAQLNNFARKRGEKEVMLMLPVLYKCTDGIVNMLPGDDMYPEDPNASNDFIKIDASMEEFRAGVKKLHRVEHSKTEKNLHLNFPLPDGQIPPVNVQFLLNKEQ